MVGFADWVFWVLPVGFGFTAWWWLTAWAWACRSRRGWFCKLGFLLIFGLDLGFAGWVWVQGVVVVDGLGLGLGSWRGGG